MKGKPRLSFWQIWNMSFGFLGIQFGFALQNANVSRIFETLGANIDDIPILWIAAPITGLIIQPIIGHWSDRTWVKLGRRRPFFLIGAILASVALLIMPNSPTLWIAAGMLWIMDASINISMEPFRAFVGDMLPSSQRTAGFAMQSFFIGLGAVIASLLPYVMTNWFDIANTAAEGQIPDSVKFSFYFGGAVFLLAVSWTVFSTKEYSPEQLKEFDQANEEENETNEFSDTTSHIRESLRTGLVFLVLGVILSFLFYFIHVEKEVYILSFGLLAFGLLEIISSLLQNKGYNSGFTSILNDLNNMPLTMKQLAVVQFFSWFALFAMWIYTTAGVTSDKYDMRVDKGMLEFLKTELINQPESERRNNILKELETYENKIKSKGQVSVNVNFVKYFLNNNLFNEKDLINEIDKSLSNTKTNNPANVELVSSIKKQINAKNPDLSYETVSEVQELVNNETIDIRFDINKFHKYVRLKEIRSEYNKGANWVGVGFGVYNGFAAIFAFLLIWIAKLTSRKKTHMLSLLVGGASFIVIFFINSSPFMLLLPFVGIGLAWASILAMPYAILTGSLPSNKMGVYMGIFNFFIVIPQILAASILGFMVKQLFNGEAIYAMIVGGVSLIIAAFLVMIVKDKN